MIRGTVAYARGKSHIRSGKSNQDSFYIMPLEDEGLFIAAAGDGCGSCKHAEIASSLAVERVCHFIRENFPIDATPISVKSMLRTAFNRALKDIYQEAEKNNNSIRDYQTTLMVVVYHYKSQSGYIASVGDGCVYALKQDGTIIPLTTRQQTEEGYVIPLSAGYGFWEIFELTEDYASLVITTDGVADKIQNASLDDGIYVPLMMLFDPHVIKHLKRTSVNFSKLFADPHSVPRQVIYNAIYRALRKDYGFSKATTLNIVSSIKHGALIETIKSIHDDITAVCLYNTEFLPKPRAAKYYMEPDWKGIHAKQQKLLYPYLETDKPDTADKNEEKVLTERTSKDGANAIRKIKLILSKLLKKVKKDV